MPKIIDLKGKVFTRLLVLEKTNERANKHVLWLCECECGNLTKATTGQLKNKGKKSCGCFNADLQKEKRTTYKYKKSKVYGLWGRMMSRCHGKCDNRLHKWYKNKGIKVCTQWKDPLLFIKWVLENGYKEGHTIHRKNSNKGYNKNNCVIITKSKHYQIHAESKRITSISSNTTGYTGVSFNKKHNFYVSYVTYNNKRKHIGCFKNAIEASKARTVYIERNKL